MKKITLLIFLAFLPFAAACNNQNQLVQEPTETSTSAEDVKREAKEAFETAATYTQEQKQKYREEIRTQLDEFDNQLDELRPLAENARESAKIKLNKQLEMLKQKREVAEQRLEKLRSSQDEGWAKVKDRLDKAMADLQKSYEGAMAEFNDQKEFNESQKKQEP